MVGKSIIQGTIVRKFGVFWDEAIAENSRAKTTLLYLLCTFTSTITQSETDIHARQFQVRNFHIIRKGRRIKKSKSQTFVKIISNYTKINRPNEIK